MIVKRVSTQLIYFEDVDQRIREAMPDLDPRIALTPGERNSAMVQRLMRRLEQDMTKPSAHITRAALVDMPESREVRVLFELSGGFALLLPQRPR